MSASLLGTGGYASILISATMAPPAVLYDATGITATADGGKCEAYSIANLDATNWLWVRVILSNANAMHLAGQAFAILPGERIPFPGGRDQNEIDQVLAWGTVPGGGPTGTAVAITCVGGVQKVV